ncbi:MAG: L-glutamate gamma-semialdehyde dehydrogenase, partial [Pseudomonadota bacterium]
LVRRLLENGANSSFVNQIVDLDVPAEDIARDPLAAAEAEGFHPHPRLRKPAEIFPGRQNSRGWDWTDPTDLAALDAARAPFAAPYRWTAAPPAGLTCGAPRAVTNPARPDDTLGTVVEALPGSVAAAMAVAHTAQPGWAATERGAILRRSADLYEAHTAEFLALAAREAGKTLPDGIAEVREAVDFLRYYADAADAPEPEARGVIVCISPWNFPLAIFTGQVAAALATGNAVLAKPAEQTPLIAARAVALLIEAGVPAGAVQLLPGDGRLGAALVADPGVGGVAFTGSTEVAKLINCQLAQTAPDAMLIAETGGLNAMVVDSTALLEQAVRDIVRSAFQSAGQRCSALRMLYVQEDIAPDLQAMLIGAMETLRLGDPWALATDVGPVIDAEAAAGIAAWCKEMADAGQVLAALPSPGGLFAAPTLIRLPGIAALPREIFGPVLHLATFKAEALDDVIADINARGYGLTFGLHTRIDRRVQHILDAVDVGNIYVNRDQIGAVVGAQPFGGHGLSGTGPKAGGPHYAPRFCRGATRPASPAAPQAAQDAPLVAADVIDAAFATLDQDQKAQAWANARDRIPQLRAALRGTAAAAMAAAASLDMGPIDLPGPTGEANQMLLRPRGRVLCLGPDPATLRDQAVQALAAGNRVVAVGAGAAEALAPLAAFPLSLVEGRLDAEGLTSPEAMVRKARSIGLNVSAFCEALGDCNCLYRAVVEALSITQTPYLGNHHHLRQEIVSYVDQNRHLDFVVQ